jgi:hypothetical protein
VNLEVMCKAFVRSIIEYGNLEYLSAAKTHLTKLDKIQTAAEKAGGFKVETQLSLVLFSNCWMVMGEED